MYGRYLDKCGYGCPYFKVSPDDLFAYCAKFGNSIVNDGDDCIGQEDEEEDEKRW